MPEATSDNHNSANGTLTPPATATAEESAATSTAEPSSACEPQAPEKNRRKRWLSYLVGLLAIVIPGAFIYFLLSRSMIWEVRDYEGPTKAVFAVTLSPNGQLAAAAGLDSTIWIWDTHTGQEVARLKGHSGLVSSLAFLPGGKQLLSGGWDRPRLWDIESGKQIGELDTPTNFILSMALSPDGKLAATTSAADHFIRIWDLPSRREVLILPGHGDKVLSVAFTPDSRHLLSAGGTSVRLWELKQVAAVCGMDLLATGDQARFREWPGREGRHHEAAAIVGRMAVPLGQGPWLQGALLAPRPALVGRLEEDFKGHGSGATWVAVAPDGKRFVSSCADGSIRLWDLNERKEIRSFSGHKSPVSCLAFSPDGKYLASTSLGPLDPKKDSDDGRSPEEKHTLRVWSLETGLECFYVDAPPHMIRSVAFAPDGRSILTGGANQQGGRAILWRVP
jgi:WD40 repeat protein